jgi:hypothetical protein
LRVTSDTFVSYGAGEAAGELSRRMENMRETLLKAGLTFASVALMLKAFVKLVYRTLFSIQRPCAPASKPNRPLEK